MSSHENITVYPEQAQKNAEFIKELKTGCNGSS